MTNIFEPKKVFLTTKANLKSWIFLTFSFMLRKEQQGWFKPILVFQFQSQNQFTIQLKYNDVLSFGMN